MFCCGCIGCLWGRRIPVESLSLAPAAGKALAGTSSPPRAVCGATCPRRETEPAVCQCWKEGISWTPGGQLDTRLFAAGVGCVCPWTSMVWDILMTWAGKCCGDDLCITSSWVVFMLSWCWAAAPWNLSHYFIFVSVLIASWSLISHCKSILFRKTSNPFYLFKIFSLHLPVCPPMCVAILLVGIYLHVSWPQTASRKGFNIPTSGKNF